MAAALEGIRVLDFTNWEQGPCATQVLGDFGSDIIKVEPLGGVDHRKGHPINGVGGYFLALNRNKKSLAVDLKADEGKKIILKIVEHTDVVVNNFRPGVMERLGFGYSDLYKVNPGIIYASATGYGLQGPYRHKKGQDLIAQSMSGLASVTGPAGGPPVACGTFEADFLGGMLLVQGILLALFHREKTGEGQEVDGSLLNGQIAVQLQELTCFLNGYGLPQRGQPGLAHADSRPTYGFYQTKDGYVAVAGSLADICEVLGMDNLEASPRYDTDEKQFEREYEIRPLLTERFLQKTRDEWLRLLDEKDVICGPVLSFDEVVKDPQVLYNEMVIQTDHPNGGTFKTIGIPVKLSKTPGKVRFGPPGVGQHTEEILTSLGYSAGEIAKLKETKVV